MFSIMLTMLAGVIVGHFLHRSSCSARVERTISFTILILLFVLGLMVGANPRIVSNLGRLGWQAVILAVLSLGGSVLAAGVVSHIILKKRKENKK